MNPFLIRKLIYPAYRAIKRDNVLGYLKEMRGVQLTEPEAIREFQWAKMKSLLEHAAARVPYYRRVFKNMGAEPGDFKTLDDLRSFPILRKSDVRENLEDLIAEGYPRAHLIHDETGGSTGQNLFFYIDRSASEAKRANAMRMDEWLDLRVGDRCAYLWGVRFRVTGLDRVKARVKNWFTNTIVLSAYRMDPDNVRRYLERLRRFKPAALIGYPSALAHLSQTVRDAGLEAFRPGLIMVSGETAYDWQRDIIEETFGAKVYNHYGSCEFGAMARECRRRDGLHIACERILMETSPIARSAGSDEIKELIITDLDDRGMPFIRYAIEDHGDIDWEPCGCGLGLPRLNGNFLGGTFWGHLLKEGVVKFQVIQDRLDHVKITVVPEGEFGEGNREYVLERVRAACGPEMKVEFEMALDIASTRTGKHRYIISNLARRDD
jgi:phenylacetate-CoA ligase